MRLERRGDIWIEASGSTRHGRSVKVAVRMSDLELTGEMPADHLERFESWKSRVRVAVYDLAGRMVRLLLDDRQPAGLHDVAWDGRREGGTQVPAGVYVVRAAVEGRTVSRAIVRVR